MKKLIVLSILALSVNVNAQPIKVAVIDTGFDFKSTWQPIRDDVPSTPTLCPTGHKDFTGNGLQDDHGHGTHIAGLIGKYSGNADYCLVIYKYYDNKGSDFNNLVNTIKSFGSAIAEGVNIINYSGGGISRNSEECAVLKTALDKGITVVAAAGNENIDLDVHPFYPALCDSRIVVVAGQDKYGKRVPSSSFSSRKFTVVKELGIDVLSILPGGQYGFMTGTSQATAIHSGKIVQKLYKMRNLDNMYIPNLLKSPKRMLASTMQCK